MVAALVREPQRHAEASRRRCFSSGRSRGAGIGCNCRTARPDFGRDRCRAAPRAMMTEPLPPGRWLPIVAISILVVAALIGNAIGIPREPAIGPVAVAASWTLGCGAVVLL